VLDDTTKEYRVDDDRDREDTTYILRASFLVAVVRIRLK
jgi:hypothetical protein